MKITVEITPPAESTHQDGTPGPWWCVVTVRCGGVELHTEAIRCVTDEELRLAARQRGRRLLFDLVDSAGVALAELLERM